MDNCFSNYSATFILFELLLSINLWLKNNYKLILCTISVSKREDLSLKGRIILSDWKCTNVSFIMKTVPNKGGSRPLGWVYWLSLTRGQLSGFVDVYHKQYTVFHCQIILFFGHISNNCFVKHYLFNNLFFAVLRRCHTIPDILELVYLFYLIFLIRKKLLYFFFYFVFENLI